MKRRIAFALTLILVATLLPLRFTAQAEAVTIDPYYLVNWDNTESSEFTYQYVYDMPFTWISASSITLETKQFNPNLFGSSDVRESALNLKEIFDSRPAGTRHINMAFLRTALTTTAQNVVNLDHGAGITKDYLTRFFTEYKRIGGKLDGIVLDLEYFTPSYWTLSSRYNSGDKNVYKNIVADTVYQTRIRPMLVERGFTFYKGDDHCELWNIHSSTNRSSEFAIWDDVINLLLAEYQNEAIADPILALYPDIIVSDYKTGDV